MICVDALFIHFAALAVWCTRDHRLVFEDCCCLIAQVLCKRHSCPQPQRVDLPVLRTTVRDRLCAELLYGGHRRDSGSPVLECGKRD